MHLADVTPLTGVAQLRRPKKHSFPAELPRRNTRAPRAMYSHERVAIGGTTGGDGAMGRCGTTHRLDSGRPVRRVPAHRQDPPRAATREKSAVSNALCCR